MDPQHDYTGSGGLVEFLLKDLIEDERELVRMFGPDHVRKMAVLWRSLVGKSAIAKPLLKMFPEHKVYVEPFAGSGAMFFNKEPVEKEVLNDLDPEIAFGFRFVQGVTSAQLKKLEGMKWWIADSKPAFDALRNGKPTGDVERFHKFLLLKLVSFFGKGNESSRTSNRVGTPTKRPPLAIGRMKEAKERLAGVVIRCEDYQKVCKEFDGPDTFQFHDPPYHGFGQNVGEKEWDEKPYAEFIKTLKSKFLITYGDKGDMGIWKGLNVKKHTVSKPLPMGVGASTGVMFTITNFDVKTVSMMRKDQRVEITAAQAAVLASGVPMLTDVLPVLKDLATGLGRLVPSEITDDAVSLERILQASIAGHQVLKGNVPDEDLVRLKNGIRGLAEMVGFDAPMLNGLAESIGKAVDLVPAPSMTPDEKRESQALRSKKWGISALDGHGERLTFPAGWSKDLEDYGDPCNLMYPCDTVERARNARIRFKQFAAGYPQDADRKIVHGRIVERELKLGIKPRFDEKDALDMLLPENLRTQMEKALGQGGGPEGDGGAEQCVCPACGKQVAHDRSTPCNEMKCPECGAAMTGQGAPGDATQKQHHCTLLKKADPAKEERYVLGFVLRANIEDKQGDIYDEAAVREAMFSWMEKGHKEGFLHREAAGNRVVLVENFQALADFEIPGPEAADGKAVKIKKGDWLQGWKILDDKMWADVKAGKLTGFSIGGRAKRTPEE